MGEVAGARSVFACRVVLGPGLAAVAGGGQEFVEDGTNGLLADFYDVQGLADRALAVLNDSSQYRPLAEAARARIVDTNEAKKCLQQLAAFFQEFQVNTSDDVFSSLAGPPS